MTCHAGGANGTEREALVSFHTEVGHLLFECWQQSYLEGFLIQ
jgi:hypothetical protein